VNGMLAAISLCCGMIGIAVEAVYLLIAYLPLQLALGSSGLAAFNPGQLQAFSSVSENFQQSGLLLSWVFYGVDELVTGF